MIFNSRLYTIFVNWNGLRRLANDAEEADWSPDGTQIAFVRDLSRYTAIAAPGTP